MSTTSTPIAHLDQGLTRTLQDAGRTVPRAMVHSYLLSGVLSLIFLISYLFTIVDIEGAINDDTGYPFLFVFRNAFSIAAVNALTAIVIVLIFAGTLSYNLSSSRQMWAVSQAPKKALETATDVFHSSLAMVAFPSRPGSPRLTRSWRYLPTLSS